MNATTTTFASTRPFDASAPTRTAGSLDRVLIPVGRMLFAAIFVMSGLTHFSAATIAYAAQAGLPMAGVLVPASGALALTSGLAIALGWHARWAAWGLVLFLVPVTVKMHAFWAVEDPMMHQMQFVMFTKNVSMLGAALLVARTGAGPVSLDARAGR